jgi:Zn-dependent protease
MRDPFAWSFPLGRWFGITVRIHILFAIFILVMWLRASTEKEYPAGAGAQMLWLLFLMFVSVLLHEFGHCAGARLVDGDAHEVLLWPLGGLASLDVPHTPRANFIATAAGPFVNFLLCLMTAVLLAIQGVRPPFDPLWYPIGDLELSFWQDGAKVPGVTHFTWLGTLALLFYVNWIQMLFNLVLVGFPLDGGRLFQCLLWPRWGYRASMRAAIYTGFIVMFVVGVLSLWKKEPMFLFLAAFIYVACKQQWLLLESGGEESLFGYDFSQGYTSLERDQPAAAPKPRRRRPNFFQRWLQRRAARKLQLAQERQAAEEQRMDELLEKIQRQGKQSLTDEEQRFLKRVADKYRNRH